MICLNYHRVDATAQPDFYTLDPARLAAHLVAIRELGLRVVGSAEVLAAEADSGMVMLHFDDGTEDHFQHVFPLLEIADSTGVFFISSAKVGKLGYLSIAQVKELAAAGHDIECHGHSHRRMDMMPLDELEGELANSVGLIREWTGRAPRILAPPGGYVNVQVIETARRHGLTNVRTMRWNTNPIPLGEMLDCLVVTGATSDAEVRQWLQGKGLIKLRVAYLAKQAVKSLLPIHLYLKLRSRLRGN